jgi:hypothetical protein
MKRPGTQCANPVLVQLVTAEVARIGATRASKTLGIGVEAILRIVAGLPVRAGTLALLRERLGDAVGPAAGARAEDGQ